VPTSPTPTSTGSGGRPRRALRRAITFVEARQKRELERSSATSDADRAMVAGASAKPRRD